MILFAALNPLPLRGRDWTKLSHHPKWHALLHFRSGSFSAKKGRINDPRFYLAPHGRDNPEAELRATVLAFQNQTSHYDRPTHCLFVERRRFLEQELGLHFPLPPCPEYEQWIQKIPKSQLSVVYAAAYASRAESIFGHTMLRMDATRGKLAPYEKLLSYAIGYGALINPKDSALAYGFKGLTGGYEGIYKLSPYYEKATEYRYLDNRELWEYRLRLNEEDILTLLNHYWELHFFTGPKYYFLTDNCSSNLLHLLQVAKPHLPLHSENPFFFLPESMLTILDEHDLIEEISFDPSNFQRVEAHYEHLSKEDKKKFQLARREKSLAKESSKDLLITLAKYFNDQKHRDRGQLAALDQDLFSETLKRLASAPKGPITTYAPKKSTYYAPGKGHGPFFFGTHLARYDQSVEPQVSFRMAAHHFLDPSAGKEPKIQAVLFQPTFSMTHNSLKLREFIAVDFYALRTNAIDTERSYHFLLSYQDTPTLACESSCPRYQSKALTGYTIDHGLETFSLFLVGIDLDYIEDQSVGLAPEVKASLLIPLGPLKTKWSLGGKVRHQLEKSPLPLAFASFQQSLTLTHQLALSSRLEWQRTLQSAPRSLFTAKVGIARYF